jgi:hypothetical protein
MRLPLLLASQLLSIAASASFPIVFVMLYGHASFGTVALIVSYSGVFLSLIAGAAGQSILQQNTSRRCLRRGIALLSAASIIMWLVSLELANALAEAVASALVVLLSQAAVHLVYYYAIRNRISALFTFVFAAECAIRIALLYALHDFVPDRAAEFLVIYVFSSLLTCLGGLVMIGGRPEREGTPVTCLDAQTCGRFVRWAVCGIVPANFDRTVFATLLPPEQRAVFMFFNGLYTMGFSIIANSVSLEVLSAHSRGFVSSKRGFLALLAAGLALASFATALVFEFAEFVAELTGFDPRWAAIPILFTFFYRALLFLQQISYGYLERKGITSRMTHLRIVSSVILMAVGAFSATLGLASAAAVSILVVFVLGCASLSVVGRSELAAPSEPIEASRVVA